MDGRRRHREPQRGLSRDESGDDINWAGIGRRKLERDRVREMRDQSRSISINITNDGIVTIIQVRAFTTGLRETL